MKIPNGLTAVDQWFLWREIDKGSGKPTKMPIRLDGSPAAVDDSKSWSSFAQACDALKFNGDANGVGFVFTTDDNFFGIDLDDCLDESQTLLPWAQPIVETFRTYWEVSPSGRGLKGFAVGQIPAGFKNRASIENGRIEVYGSRRFFTVTGDWFHADEFDLPKIKFVDASQLCEKYLPKRNAGASLGFLPEQASDEFFELCLSELKKLPNSVSGESGHDSLLRAACETVRFNLTDASALRALKWFNKNKCIPPWSQYDLERKLSEAKKIAGEEQGAAVMFVRPKTHKLELPTKLIESDDLDIEKLASDAPGFVGKITNWILETSWYKHPQLALGASIATLATVLGRRYCDDNNTRTNIYILSLGETSSGKNDAFVAPRLLFNAAGLSELCGFTNFGSRLALTRHLEQTPSQLFRIDEADNLFRDMNSNDVMSGLAEDFKTLWSESNNLQYRGSGFIDPNKTVTIDQPNASLYCTATPRAFFESLSGRDIEGGLIGRFIVLQGVESYPPRNNKKLQGEHAAPPKQILDFLKWQHGRPVIHGLAPWHQFAVQQSPESKEMILQFMDDVRDVMRENVDRNPEAVSAIGKSPEIAAKLALIAGICNGRDGIIGRNETQWAINVARLSSSNISAAMDSHVSRSKFESLVKKLRARGREAGELSLTEVSRVLRVPPQLRTDVINHLAECNELCVDIKKTTTKPVTVYRFT